MTSRVNARLALTMATWSFAFFDAGERVISHPLEALGAGEQLAG
jgi:hypothetical protein